MGGSYSKCFTIESFFHLYYHLKSIINCLYSCYFEGFFHSSLCLLNLRLYCFILYHISKLWLFLSFLQLISWNESVISPFDHCCLLLHSKSSPVRLSFRNCFTSRLDEVRFIYSSFLLQFISRKHSKRF